MRVIFQNRAVALYNFYFFRKLLSSLVSAIWTYKNADEKEHTFHELEKRTKTDTV